MREISIKELNLNPYDKIAKEWMLLTAGGESRGYNTMTCSWGHLPGSQGCWPGLPSRAPLPDLVCVSPHFTPLSVAGALGRH